MKNAFIVALFQLAASAVASWAATSPLYINDAPMVSPPDIPPQIDAAAFANRSVFSVDNLTFLQPLPYETDNTLFFTNEASGVMLGAPGFRFNYASGNQRQPMDTWVNRGSISADSSSIFISGFFLSGASANWLLVSATNIVSTGPMNVGSQGLMHLEGKNINLSRNGLRSGEVFTNNFIFFSSSLFASNYVNDVGISDIYWGLGTNNSLGNNGRPMGITNTVFNAQITQDDLLYSLSTTGVRSPWHEVVENFGSGFYFTNRTVLPFSGFFGSSGSFYNVVAYTNQVSPTNFITQLVFLPTNFFQTNITTEVRFYPDFSGFANVVVGYHIEDFDIVTQRSFTNSIYLADGLATETNTFLARARDPVFAQNVGTRRPNTYEVTRTDPGPWLQFFPPVVNGNATFRNSMIYNPTTYQSNRVDVRYAAYQANISSINSPGFTTPGSALSDPTNFAGRIEIFGQNVNLDQTRVRADSTFILRASNITSNRFAQVDAPFVVFDVGSDAPSLVITNLAPPSVRRLSGTVSAWSSTWRNYESVLFGTNVIATNAIDFHVLIVDDTLQGQQPVTVTEFGVRATNVVIGDNLSVTKSVKINATGLEVTGGINFPQGSSWGATNVQNLYHLTNRGDLVLSGVASFGADRPSAYSNFVNSGTISSSAQLIRAGRFENTGCLTANGGVLSIRAGDGFWLGQPTDIVTNVETFVIPGLVTTFSITNVVTNSFGAKLAANSDVEYFGNTLLVSNSIVQGGLTARGGMVLSVTNRLTDAGTNALNDWRVTAGFQALTKPATSDLLGTQIRSTAVAFSEVFHTWASDNLGAVATGFSNNLALGKVIFDAQGAQSLFNFTGNRPNQALYVDFIQLENYATNYNTAFSIDPGFTIYFADANVSASKLDHAAGNRFRWVPSFAGPYSATNLIYPSGQIVTMNRALATSKDRDSDYDGIPNGLDPTPIFIPESVDLNIAFANATPNKVVISWNALGRATNSVLFKTSLTPGSAWQSLTQLVTGPLTMPVSVEDDFASGVGQRFYRIQIDPRP